MKNKFKLMQSLRLSLDWVAIVFVMTFFATIAARSAEIIGTAYDGDSNQGEVGVGVTLRRLGAADPSPKRKFTQPDGNYSFRNLVPGKYRLDFNKVGYTIVVPYKEPIELKSSSTANEPVRAYSKATNINVERLAAFLQERSKGDTKRLAADIKALRETGAFDSRTVSTIELVSSQPARTTGRIALVKPDSNSLLIIPKRSSNPVKYYYTESTVVLEANGRTLSANQLSSSGFEKTATILYKKDPEGRSIAKKIVLEDEVTFNATPAGSPR